MITVNDSQSLTSQLLIDELELWGLFDSKSISDDKTKRYYQLIDDLLDSQIGESIAWLQSDEAKEYFFEQVELQKEIFDALEDSWDTIFDGHYEKVDDLLDAIYDEGKRKGYSQIKETLNYTDADIQAIRLAKDYNYDLIRNLTSDLQNTVKNKILQGIISGENPYSLSRILTKAGVTKLDGSPFTARQRATMIAKTETSRMQNTGMLQSYVNEGYTQVKILTAEDKDVCTTCLEYAFKFNKDEPRVYSPELLEREKVHDIVTLIKGGKFPPFHPVCRCTYLTVWETKTDAPSNPPIINLTPIGADIRRQEYELPEPTKEQLMKNLRPQEREKYENCKRNIPKQKEWLQNNPNAPAEEIAKHQKRLAFLEKKFLELKKKALGGEANIPVKKPKPNEPKKPVEEKPKKEKPTSEEPKPQTPVEKPTNKPTTPQEPITVTRGQLEDGLNETELKEYDDIVKRIERINKWLANDPLSHGFTKSDVDRQKEILQNGKERIEELKKQALNSKPKTPKVSTPTDAPKPEDKPQISKINFDEKVSELRKDLPISSESFDEILKWSKKRVKNKTRYGREYDTSTGELYPRETKGREYICQFTSKDSPNVVRITSMGKGEDGIPSSTDFKLSRASANQDFLFVSNKEIWYIHSNENFGLSSLATSQKEIDTICRNASRDARSRVMDLVREGKLSRDDVSALREAQMKFEGDNLLKAFSSKSWEDKGFIVRRAQREDIKTVTRKSSKPNTKETVDTTHIDKSKLTYDNLKTPEEIAVFYDLEYVPELNAKGKIVSQKFIDHMTYVDPSTGEKFNHKMEIVFDSTFVGPNRRKAKNLIDTTNSGQCKYDQKELIRIVKEAPEVYKFATGQINFTGKDRYANRSFQPNELGNATWYRSYEIKNNKYYLKGVNSIMMPYLPLSVNHENRGTARQTLYHEMSHLFDYSLIKGEPRDLMVKGTTTGLSREEIIKLNQYLKAGYGHGVSGDKSWKDVQKDEYDYQGKNNYPQEGASWYGTVSNAPEHWAETGSMAAISLTDDLTDAVMEDYRHNSVKFDDWSKYHKPTLDYAVKKIKSIKPSMFTYKS
ncbi:phage minor head protein [uncultured Methanobrevibacter sp.]|uniref:phage minor head protein n=1 Tax=uncultured Methanobrevibacter sp. TaxID=253161 RepID=UPI0025E8FE4A|nr:phage minor head protein [uncultured Methanobrevibacter sp.]